MTWTTRPRSDLGGLSAITAGTGPLVVLLHGVGLRAEAWNRQIDALRGAHRVIAIDLPGHGDSTLPAEEPDLDRLTDLIAARIPGRALIIGHSMGAMLALGLAVRHPDKTAGVAALNAVYRRPADAAAAVRARAAALDGVGVADPSATLARWFGAARSPERSACEAWLRGVKPAGYRMAYGVFAQGDAPADAALAALRCPALFMTGAQEPNSTPAMAPAMAALAPDGCAQIIQDAAHMMPMTHPLAVNAALEGLAARVFA